MRKKIKISVLILLGATTLIFTGCNNDSNPSQAEEDVTAVIKEQTERIIINEN